ncbi:MAG: Transposase DDE domain protein [bacterium ADurb.Bin425]|nr:MAG: Transposase DDE domain protein [bacterium ADurb.Bin425]
MRQSKTKSDNKQGQMRLDLPNLKPIVLEFDGGRVCSDGGLLLLRKADQILGLAENACSSITDERRSGAIKHKAIEMFRQRIYGIAAGYEDCNDASQLRFDAMHRLAIGKDRALASQPSLSRFENQADSITNAALQKLLIHTYIKRTRKTPQVLRLAMDTTCDEAYGRQQMIEFSGFYETYCFAPLFIFTEDGFPIWAQLRPGAANVIQDAIRAIKLLVKEIRLSWPRTRIELTADAGFASGEFFDVLEDRDITYFIAAAGHNGFQYHAEKTVFKCKDEFEAFGCQSPALKKYGLYQNPGDRKAALRRKEQTMRYASKDEGRMQELFEAELHIRKYGEFSYSAREWRNSRRVIFRVEYTMIGPDTRFVITNHKNGSPRKLYEKRYCPRAQCENWIKDLKLYLQSGRTSCQEFEANQFRLFLHVFAYILTWEVRKRARLRAMTVETFRLQLLKIGVLVKQRSRNFSLHLASEFPWQEQYRIAWRET